MITTTQTIITSVTTVFKYPWNSFPGIFVIGMKRSVTDNQPADSVVTHRTTSGPAVTAAYFAFPEFTITVVPTQSAIAANN